MDWPITAWRWARQGRATPPEAGSGRGPGPAEAEPFALVERTGGGLILHALTPQARALGLKLHQSHADACAIVPNLASAPAEPARAAQALRRLAGWMERYSPFVTLDSTSEGLEGLFIDLTGGQHLFGGEGAMVKQMLAALEGLGAPARIGVADTPGAAWALARYGGGVINSAPEQAVREALAGLPVAGLRLSSQAVQLLNRFGLRRIGALYDLPRAALARRFRDAEALNVLQRLDQALGVLGEPLTPVTAPAIYRVQTVFFEPMTSPEVVALEAASLVDRLAATLEQDGMGARRLRLTGFRVDGRVTRLEVRLAAPSRKSAHLLRLLRDKGYEHLDLGFGVDALALSALVAEPLHARQVTVLDDRIRAQAEARDALIDRLAARLGQDAVLSPRPAESWLPEAAERLMPFLATQTDGKAPCTASPHPEAPAQRAWIKSGVAPQDEERNKPLKSFSNSLLDEPATPPDLGARPILLFDPPEPIEAMAELPDGAPARFTWRRAPRRVTRASGPERLAPEWWKLQAGRWSGRARDYYRIEDEAGGRYWVFREGLYGLDLDPPPRWWMHGLFP